MEVRMSVGVLLLVAFLPVLAADESEGIGATGKTGESEENGTTEETGKSEETDESKKTDVVVLKNGDHLVGEIKEMTRARLSFKTDSMDTIGIEWNDILGLTSNEKFQIETNEGEFYFGSLSYSPEEGKLRVVGVGGPVDIEFTRIVRVTPIKTGFWKKVNGSVDLGFSYTQANTVIQFSFTGSATYRTRESISRLSLNSIISDADDLDQTSRQDLTFRHTRLLKKKRLAGGFLSFQSNDELGIDLRTLVGGIGGYNVIQEVNMILGLQAGLAYNVENVTNSTETNESLEGVLSFEFATYTYDDPVRDILIILMVFPSVTESGRVRAEFHTKIRWEMFDDFYLSLDLLDSYDSDPPTVGAEKNDVAFILGFGYSF